MTLQRKAKIGIATTLVLCLAAGIATITSIVARTGRTQVSAYFDNSNGIFVGDDVMILGVAVGTIDKIEPQATRVKITFSVDDQYKVPADAKAVIINPTLVTARAIQLTPAYTGGPVLAAGTAIPQNRTAVPVEFDDLRKQLQKLTDALQPTQPGGVSTLGSFIDTAANNLRGQGANIREALIQLSQTFSALGDHSSDLFGTLHNLSVLTTGLQSSSELLASLNNNLSTVTGLLATDPHAIDNALKNLNVAVGDVNHFLNDNRELVGTTFDKLASISKALGDSIGDIKQTLHITPTAFQNFINIYEPANGALTGVLAVNNFANPLTFLCGAIQAASRLNADQSSKLCVQYLAPIVKNRQFNFPPVGENALVGAIARPNEVTFSEDWLRPQTEAGRVRDFYEGPLADEHGPAPAAPIPAPLAAEAPSPSGSPSIESTPTNPSAGLSGMMVPPGAGS